MRRDSEFRERLVIAALEELLAVLLVLVDADPARRRRGCEHRPDIGSIPSGNGRRPDARSFRIVGAAELLEVYLRIRLIDGKNWIPRVVSRADKTLFFTEVGDEND